MGEAHRPSPVDPRRPVHRPRRSRDRLRRLSGHTGTDRVPGAGTGWLGHGTDGRVRTGQAEWSSSLPAGAVRKSAGSSSKEPFQEPHYAVTNTSPFGGRQALIDETAPNGCSASFELCRPTARATRAESAIRSLVLLSICNRFLLSQLSCRSPDAVMCTQSLWLYMDPAVNVSTPLNRTAVRVRLGRHVGRLRSAARSAGTRAVISESRRRWPLSSHHCRAIDLSVEPNMLTFPAGISTVESTWVGCHDWCLA